MSLDDHFLDEHDQVLCWKIDGKVLVAQDERTFIDLKMKGRVTDRLTNKELERFKAGDYNPAYDYSDTDNNEAVSMMLQRAATEQEEDFSFIELVSL